MKPQEIDILLETLDTTLNSNSFWITLDLTENEEQVETEIIQHLRTGSFHFELVKEDLRREFNDYSEIIFPKASNTPIVLQKPGNLWNGVEQLTIDEIGKSLARDMLIDLLTGKQDFFSASTLGTQINTNKANELIANLFEILDEKGDWKAYNIEPDFLYQVESYNNTNPHLPGYFENDGRDLALAIKYDAEVHILLTCGYS
ncbi:hypothetical protein VH441_02095 [Psychrobacter sp. HD31]|uniref:hypothetical protein n=1 Tax=Psychrobacter sp. HD31 TaxID=3112003 RepID=UPI003DA3E1B3